MSTNFEYKRVKQTEVNQWIRWLEREGYRGPFYGLTPKHDGIKRLARELRINPPVIPRTRRRDARTIIGNLNKYERGRRGIGLAGGYVDSVTQKHLGEHFQRLYELLKRFEEQFQTPKLTDLCLSSISDNHTISYSYESNVPVPSIIYEDKSIRLGVESSFSPPWEYLTGHIKVEFEEFDGILKKWKEDTTSLVILCSRMSNSISNLLTRNKWPAAQGDLSIGVYYEPLVRAVYDCVVTGEMPEFVTIPMASVVFSSELYIRYSNGMPIVARGDATLLNQVQDYCSRILKSAGLRKSMNQISEIVSELEKQRENLKDLIKPLMERHTFKGNCPGCIYLVF